jgi:hypothetical protein
MSDSSSSTSLYYIPLFPGCFWVLRLDRPDFAAGLPAV